MIAITVIVPVYNEERHVEETIKCLKNQTFQKFECLIVNDCSTDSSKQVIMKNIKDDRRFIYIENKVNIGLAATRNVGLFYACGEYVVFLDSDDILSKTALAERYSIAKNNNLHHVAGSYGKHKSIEENVKIYPESTKTNCSIISFQSSLGDNPFVIHSPLVNKEISIGIDGFNESLKLGAEDYDFWIRILRHGYIFIPTNYFDCFYRQKEYSMIRQFSIEHLKTATNILKNALSPCEDDYFYSKANLMMKMPAHAYKTEEILFKKILHFIGLSMFSDISNDDFKLLSKKLPNFASGFPFHLSAIQTMREGVQRKMVGVSCTNHGNIDNLIVKALSKIAKYSKDKGEENDIHIATKDHKLECNKSHFDLVFIPHKDYHVNIIKAFSEELIKNNIKFIVADCSAQYKDEGVSAALQETGLPHTSFVKIAFGDFRTKGIVVFNDWDTQITRPAILAAQKSNILSIGVVEGIQDYEDKDTGRSRQPYKTVKDVILPCRFDAKYFSGGSSNVHIAGMPRIHELKTKGKEAPLNFNSPIVINVNFSYGVLEVERDNWVFNAVNACTELGLQYVITQHPADTGDLSRYNVTTKTMYDAILDSSMLISRFSTAIIEAIAMDRPVIYFNPHSEKVDKFFQSCGAYYTAANKDELKSAIIQTKKNIGSLSANWKSYLSEHAGYDADHPEQASQQISKALSDILAEYDDQKNSDNYTFNKNLMESFQNITCLKNSEFAAIVFESVKNKKYDDAIFQVDCFECKRVSAAEKLDFYSVLFEKVLFTNEYGCEHTEFIKFVCSKLIDTKLQKDIHASLLIAYSMYKFGNNDVLKYIEEALIVSEYQYLTEREDVKIAIEEGAFVCGLHHYYLHHDLENLQWPDFELFKKFFKCSINDVDMFLTISSAPAMRFVKQVFLGS